MARNIVPQADTRQPAPLAGLAHALVQNGVLTADRARALCRDATHNATSFAAQAVISNAVSAGVLADTAARTFGMPRLDLRTVDLTDAPLDAVTPELIRKHQMLPIRRDGNLLTVALADPARREALQEFGFQSGLQTTAVVVEQDVLCRLIEHRFSELDSAVAGLGTAAPIDAPDLAIADTDSLSHAGAAIQNAPVVRFIDKVLQDAIRQGASDIHFEPYDQHYRIRLRQDGVLHGVAEPPAGYSPQIASRLKVMARLDLAERRLPQDGRMTLGLPSQRAIDCRVSTCPTLHGEKIVLRILDPERAQLDINTLGMDATQQALFERAIQRPYGMVLVTGPTGSGKTVSLYSALDLLNAEQRNISTVEDPAEINLHGINQVNVHPRIGLDFATCLRTFLRQDPDVIMVGEMRDRETAEIAIKAAQTGHMVLSTVHTNNAPQTLTRLANMGVPAYNIAASVTLIVAQRLARMLCPRCKVPTGISRSELDRAGLDMGTVDRQMLFDANTRGCEHCTGGFKGRVGLFEVMPVTEAIGRIIMQGGTAHDIEHQARQEGVTNLYQAGLTKVRAGILSLGELHRVTVT